MFLKPRKQQANEDSNFMEDRVEFEHMQDSWNHLGWKWMDVPEQLATLPKKIKEVIGESKAASVLLDENQNIVFFINYEKMI